MPMTAQQIESRDFTYCTVVYSDRQFGFYGFVVGTPFRPEARERAKAYATAKWGHAPDKIDLYPRTYISDARRRFAQGLHD